MFARFRSLHLGTKIGLSVTLFLLPVLLILALLVQGQNKDILFASNEVAGTRALAYLGVLQRIGNQRLLGDAAEPVPAPSDDVVAAFAELDLSDTSRTVVAVLRDARDGAMLSKARAGVRDLQAAVGDHSNLILDNFLETYYLSDVVLNRSPDLLDRLAEIGALAAGQGASADARADFLIGVGGLAAVVDAMDASLASAIADNVSGGIKAALSEPHDVLHRELTAFLGRLKEKADAGGSAELLLHSAAFMARANADLQRLLVDRVNGLHRTQRLAFAGALGLFVLAAIAMWLVIRASVVRPLKALCRATELLAKGDLEAAVPQRLAKDEVGQLAQDIAAFRRALIDKMELEREQARKEMERQKRYLALNDLARDFNSAVSGQLSSLSHALMNLYVDADAARDVAVATSQAAEAVGARTALVSGSTQMVAEAAEEMGVNSRDIASAVAHSTEATAQMLAKARQANTVVQELTDVVQSVTGVVDLITGIAGQTNLLALNATIEAARAGEAGRGFAVVASEVKALAAQTARATEDIGRRVGAVRDSAARAAELVAQVSVGVATVETSAGAIAEAVGKQEAATGDIRRHIQAAGGAVQDVAERMEQLGRDAHQSQESSTKMLEAFQEMSRMAEILGTEVGHFIANTDKARDQRSYQRYSLERDVAIEDEDQGVLPLRLIDIGQGGAAGHCPTPLRPGAAVLLRDLVATPLKARVVAWDDGVVRLQFRFDSGTEAAIADFMAALIAERVQKAA